ncbi:hypothetical protein BDW74DRAFT_174227 [Aspergillus multicolor]|uniref:uncharacterized protein n=1 Tax=Aspergillus multicolor TaxID=41759 RepID=UPI003CCCCAE9
MFQSTQALEAHRPTTLARFLLSKFSYTTTSINHRGPLNWNHVFGDGTVVGIFEKYVALSSARVLFRVVRNDQETLEEVGITDLVKEFEGQFRSWQDGSRHAAFAVVVKLPCLAVKYPQGPGYVRRFQVKFSSDRDFYSALAILSEISCPFSESNVSSTRPMSRTTSSLANLGHIGSGLGPQHSPPTTTDIPSLNNSMRLSYRPFTSSSTIANSPPDTDTIVPSSSFTYTTPDDSSRRISSSALGSNRRTPFEPTFPTTDVQRPITDTNPFKRPSTSAANFSLELEDIPQVIQSRETDRCNRPSTSTGLNELDLPPKRVLPFSNGVAKRNRPKPTPTPAKKASTNQCARSPKANGISSSPTKSTRKPPAPRTTKGTKAKAGPRKTQSTPSSKPLEELFNSPNKGITINAEKTTATPQTLFEQLPIATPEDLAKYALEPVEERIAGLQSWLCAHLEDPNFTQLCEDIEGVAERFYLGR